MTIDPEKKLMLISLIVGLIFLLFFSVLTQDIGVIINVGVMALFIVIGPMFIHRYLQFMWLKGIEKEFPNFVRDLANLKQSGMSLTESVKMASKTNYGKLTPEVKKFSNRLTWGTDFLRSLEIFGQKFNGSRVIKESLDIMKEAYLSGADISVTLDSLSKDLLTLKDIDEERKSMVRQHVMVMYGIFFMFVGISVAIIYVLVPMMTSQADNVGGGAGAGGLVLSFKDPCEITPYFFPCEYFNVLCASFGVSQGIGCYYVALFVTILVIQAIFMGLIAGQVGENSVTAGIKHSMIMLASSLVIFAFLIQANLLPV